MNCTVCGAPVMPGDAFCPKCGTAVTQPSVQSPIPPTQPMPQVVAAPQQQYPSAQPTEPMPQPQPQPQPGQYAPRPQTLPTTPAGPPPPKGLSGGAIAGIIVGVVAVLLILNIAGVFAMRTVFSAEDGPVAVAPVPEPAQTEPLGETTPSEAEQPAEQPAEEPSAADDGIVTDEQARSTVTSFLDARLAKDVAASKEYCSQAFLSGEKKPMLDDATWRPDSYEIVNSAPDLMYVHVVVLERWPSGDEHAIYSVFIDPEAKRPLIDAMLDPQYVPELIPE